jgi:hypothetical protein
LEIHDLVNISAPYKNEGKLRVTVVILHNNFTLPGGTSTGECCEKIKAGWELQQGEQDYVALTYSTP